MRQLLSAQRGVRLALDWGRARIGVAACDPDGTLAYPVETIATSGGTAGRTRALQRVQALVEEYQAVEVVLGWPTDLGGRAGPAVAAMTMVAADLEEAIAPVPVVQVDERLTSAQAARKLSASQRSTRQQRAIIDQVAAVGILESALDARRAQTPTPDMGEGERNGDQ